MVTGLKARTHHTDCVADTSNGRVMSCGEPASTDIAGEAEG